MTCRVEVLSAAQALTRQSHSGQFTVDEILGYLRSKGCRYQDSTIRTHVTSRMCANAPDNHGTTYDDFQRLGPGRYRLNRKGTHEVPSTLGSPRPVACQPNVVTVARNHDLHALSEDETKQTLDQWLRQAGWSTTVAWGHAPGVDIEATKPGQRWLIEVKGPGSRPPMRVNYFLAILGETLQRMVDDTAQYSIALPDLPQYRGLWDRLPDLAKRRTQISAIFVDADGTIDHTAPN